MAKQIRSIVYWIAGIVGVGAYYGLWPLNSMALHLRYGVLATIFLYLTLLASPLYIAFPKLPYKIVYLRARKALGLSAFSFSFLHGITAFRDALGGFQTVKRAGFHFLWPYLLGALAVVIMALMAATSPPQMVNKLGRNWKRLHRFVYLA